MIKPFRHLRAGQDRVSAAEYNRLVDVVTTLSNVHLANSMRTSSGISTRSPFPGIGTSFKIFEVQSAATGDGIYTCYEQTLDSTKWADEAGDDKFDDKDSVEIDVFNLLENDCVAAYAPALCLYDRLQARQWMDDEGNKRLVGIPIAPSVRRARTTEAAPAATNLTCNIILNNDVEAGVGELGYNIEVYCSIVGSANLNAAAPRLANDDYLFVQNIQGKWWCVTVFQATEDCDCYSV